MSIVWGSCHCGAVEIMIPEAPKKILQCNCSLCRKTGWIGGYYGPADIRIEALEDVLVRYVQGDKMLALWHCKTCGSTTHWTPLTAPPDRMGINMRLFDRELWQEAKISEVDGASF
tara:strand:- start:1061 stop:1408 length:348 start_codon:yes stop_codon:yes gene_type:complete